MIQVYKRRASWNPRHHDKVFWSHDTSSGKSWYSNYDGQRTSPSRTAHPPKNTRWYPVQPAWADLQVGAGL